MKSRQPDPAEIAVIGHALHSVAVEMGIALRRTAFSPNIKERRDYSSAVFSAAGDLIAMGDDMPVHLGSMPMSVSAVLAAMRLAHGDVAILNDPYRGGTHLPDITMVAPVFLRGRSSPAFYVANRAHHADVGGMHPGSMGPAREIVQEGIRIPPVKLMHAGKLDEQVLAVLLANVRTPAEREGDITAQLGACRIGVSRMLELVERFGHTRLLRGIQRHDRKAPNNGCAQSSPPFPPVSGMPRISSMTMECCLVPSGFASRSATIPSSAPSSSTSLGTDPQVPGSVNAVYAITWSAVFYVFRCLLPPEAIATAGLMRPVQVLAPAGTVVNACPTGSCRRRQRRNIAAHRRRAHARPCAGAS